jgi:4-amino-4-deoxy-L-arabinose transferase-like glycosyltransferase
VAAEWAALGVGIDDLDEGYFVQQATRVLHGQVPFRDFDTLYSPGLMYVHAGLFAVLGGPSIIAVRMAALLSRAGIAVLLYALSRPFVKQAWWAAAPAVAVFIGFDDAPVRWEPHPGWFSTFFALLAVWCASQCRSTRWLIASGVAGGLAFLFKQNTGAFMIGAVGLWSGPRLREPLAAFGAVTLAWLVPLTFANRADLSALAPLVGGLNEAGLASSPDATNLIALGCMAGGLWLMRRDWHPLFRWYMLAGVALYLTELPRMDTLHLAWSAPLLLVFGAIALDRMRLRAAAAWLLAGVLLATPSITSRISYLAQPPATIDGLAAPAQTADDLAGVVADVQARTRQGEPMFVYPTSPLLYVLADRPNPTRFDHLNPGAADPAQIQQVIADLQRSNIELIVISDYWRTAWGPPAANLALEQWLDAHFTIVSRHGSYRVLTAHL